MHYVQNLTTNYVEILNKGLAVLPPGFSGWVDGNTNTLVVSGTNAVVQTGGAFSRVLVSPSGLYVTSLDWFYTVPLTIFFVWFFYKLAWRLLSRTSGNFGPSPAD